MAQDRIRLLVILAATAVLVLLLAANASAANAYIQHNIISDIQGMADHTDPGLVNPWGMTASSTSPFWFSDTGSGLSTLYSTAGSGSIPGLTVTINPSATGGTAMPTGIVFNGGSGFEAASGKPAFFLFDGLDGTITAWSPTADMTHALVKVDNSSKGAVYTGLAIATSGGNTLLYAANVASGKIEIYNSNFVAVDLAPTAFTDPKVPSGYGPYNIQVINGLLYVTFAQFGSGGGYVATFDLSGNLVQHLISGGQLNAPWGVAIAPAGFGDFANDLLVGNFGDGTINVYDPTSGAYIATLQDTTGNPISIEGLWALFPGNGANGGDKNAVYFTAGISHQKHGLFGSIQASPSISANAVVNGASFQPVCAPNTFITIQGANLASTTREWQSSDFVNNALPTSLDGVSVMIDGKPAYINYVSPTQINALTPADMTQGAVNVTITNATLTSAPQSVQLQAVAPAFFLFKSGPYIAATHANGSLIGPVTLFQNMTTPAKPGETISLYGTGFGPTTPTTPDGQLLSGPLALTTDPVVTFGGAQASVTYAGLVEPGVFQINVVVPASTANGDIPVVAQVGGQSSPMAAITVQQ